MTKTRPLILGSAALLLAGGATLWYFKWRAEAARPSTEAMLARIVKDDLKKIDELILDHARVHGALPKRLEEMESSGSDFVDWYSRGTACRRKYGYAIADNGTDFAATSVGPDAVAETEDDIAIVHRGQVPEFLFGTGTSHELGITTSCLAWRE
jgi:hypothetical protein